MNYFVSCQCALAPQLRPATVASHMQHVREKSIILQYLRQFGFLTIFTKNAILKVE